MEQHAVPQSITTYKFRLVGDMTLKQFLELAFGVVIAWLIFNSKINFLFKWTLAPFFAFFGFALAFVPLEDRPLDAWLLNFFKALVKPTQFIYRTQPKVIDIFTPNPPVPLEKNYLSNQPENLAEYLKTLPGSPITAFDLSEQKYLEHITSLFGTLGLAVSTPVTQPAPQPTNPYKSTVRGVRIRRLLTPQMCLLPHNVIFEAPVESKQAAIPASTRETESTRGGPIAAKPATAPHDVLSPSKNEVKPKSAAKVIPIQKPVVVKESTGQNPVFAANIVLPHLPDKPNLIAGITLDKAGKILTGVIIEIIDKQNLPVRALKSNKLGQFFIATPLNDGVYQIRSEHQDHKFAIIKLEAKGEIIPPLKIQATDSPKLI